MFLKHFFITSLLVQLTYTILTNTDTHLPSQSNYNYIQGGEDWPELCQNNNTQSPVNIIDSITTIYNSVFFHLSDIEIHIAQYNNKDPNQYTLDGYFARSFFIDQLKRPYYYNMTTIYVHSPSEHKINDKEFDLEIQFGGQYINGINNNYNQHQISFFFNTNKTQVTPNNLFHSSKQPSNSTDYRNLFIDQLISLESYNTELYVNKIFSEDLTNFKFYVYEGSLTKPPCTESVLWFIVNTPFQIGIDQLNYFKDKWQNNKEFANGRGNNRKVKDFNGTVFSNGGEY